MLLHSEALQQCMRFSLKHYNRICGDPPVQVLCPLGLYIEHLGIHYNRISVVSPNFDQGRVP